MSEKDPKNFETFEADHSARHETPEKRVEHAESKETKPNKAERLEAVRHVVNKESAEKKELLDQLNTEHESEEDDVAKRPVNSRVALANEIRQIRRKLSKGDRIGSKVIHQPVIKTVSEVSSKTITRPSGLLGGGITAFLGTSAYLFFTKYIGLKYNYSVFLFLLVAGFILGLIVEAVFRVSKGRSTS